MFDYLSRFFSIIKEDQGSFQMMLYEFAVAEPTNSFDMRVATEPADNQCKHRRIVMNSKAAILLRRMISLQEVTSQYRK